jgi:hypothetical protein
MATGWLGLSHTLFDLGAPLISAQLRKQNELETQTKFKQIGAGSIWSNPGSQEAGSSSIMRQDLQHENDQTTSGVIPIRFISSCFPSELYQTLLEDRIS